MPDVVLVALVLGALGVCLFGIPAILKGTVISKSDVRSLTHVVCFSLLAAAIFFLQNKWVAIIAGVPVILFLIAAIEWGWLPGLTLGSRDRDYGLVGSALGFVAVAYLNLGEPAPADSIARLLDGSREQYTTQQNHAVDVLLALVRGDRLGALRANRQGASLAPPNAGEWFNYGAMAIWANYVQEAIDAFANWDPASPGVQGTLSRRYWRWLTAAHHMLGNHRAELKEARRGREQYPTFVTLLFNEVRALAALGRVRQVEQLLDESAALTPDAGFLPTTPMLAAAAEFRAHAHPNAADKTLDRIRQWYEAQPEEEVASTQHRRILGDALAYAGRWEGARDLFYELAVQRPDIPAWLGRVGVLAARLGDNDQALRIDEQLAAINKPYLYGSPTLYRARIAAVLGERQRAVSLLSNAFTEGLSYGIWLHRDIDFETLHDYPAFQELLRPKG